MLAEAEALFIKGRRLPILLSVGTLISAYCLYKLIKSLKKETKTIEDRKQPVREKQRRKSYNEALNTSLETEHLSAMSELSEGTVIESAKNKFVVGKLLGEGGFGAVYKVHLESDKQKSYAMKVEKKVENRKHSKLKMEIAILKLVSSERKQSHFTSIVDRGKKENFFFLVMQLVGKSLSDLKTERPEKVLSIVCGLSVSKQCLEACQDLHKYGFIHRDLKPANYANGLDSETRLIYILDFGIARKIVNEKGELKTPRASVKFKGTVRFASLACHRSQELGSKDDCESWFYLMLDLIQPSGLPWKKAEKSETIRLKEECRKEKKDLLLMNLKCKTELGKLLDYFVSLQYHDRVDYEYAYKLIGDAASVCGGSLSDPYDWE